MQPTIVAVARNGSLNEALATPLSVRRVAWIDAAPGMPAVKAIDRHRPALVVLDSGTDPDRQVFSWIETIRGRCPATPLFLIARQSSEALAIGALKRGVDDYFKPPLCAEAVLSAIDRILDAGPRHPPPAAPADRLSARMVGSSRIMTDLRVHLERISMVDSTVLITGETGTGKELAAGLIHDRSRRGGRTMVNVNCAAVPDSLVESELFGHARGAYTGAVTASPGRLEQARGGTVFLDEIGDMTPFAQAKILRVIEEKAVAPLGGGPSRPLDFRLVAATNRDPELLMAEGAFRDDLFYRLNVARVHMPSLRDHREDIPQLVDHAIARLNHSFRRAVQGLADDAMDALMAHDWPGNVRELMNLLESTFINRPVDAIRFTDLPETFRRYLAESRRMPDGERARVLAALMKTNWNRSSAARKLNWSRMTLYRKMIKYQIVEHRRSE